MTLSAADAFQAGILQGQNPWLWLYRIEVPTSPATSLRLARYKTTVSFGTNSAGEPVTWSPFPITHRFTSENTEGVVRPVEITVSNVTREIAALLEAYDGLRGQPVEILLVNHANLATGVPARRGEYKVKSVRETSEGVHTRVGTTDPSGTPFPKLLLLREKCNSGYKSSKCGYVGVITSCDKTLGGDNGCEVHDNSSRFGGYPGMRRPQIA